MAAGTDAKVSQRFKATLVQAVHIESLRRIIAK